MTLQSTFEITMRQPTLEAFPIDAVDNDWLWLPKLGPTPFILLRTMQRDLAQLDAEESATYIVDELGARCGVPPSRCWRSIERLVHFDFVYREPPGRLMNTFSVFAGMRKPTRDDLRRLPPTVLAGYRALKESEVA